MAGCCDGGDSKTPSCCGERADAKPVKSCCGPDDHGCCNNNNGRNVEEKDRNNLQKEQEDVVSSSSFCIAVVREGGNAVVLFDVAGVPRTFTFKGDARMLCFRTHGMADTMMVDDLLTPCFDNDGYHGVPEEPCFCGVETSHIHAHLDDPELCSHNNTNQAKTNSSNDSSFYNRVGSLASQILYPEQEDDEVFHRAVTDKALREKLPLLHIGISEQMPKACNSKEVQRTLGQVGIHHRRVHKVQHDDHVDDLVHDSRNATLHLQHACDGCGDQDVHGTFRLMGRRRLQRDGEPLDLHIFEVSPRPFRLLDFFDGLYDVSSSDRVAAVSNLMGRAKAEAEVVVSTSPKLYKPLCTAAAASDDISHSAPCRSSCSHSRSIVEHNHKTNMDVPPSAAAEQVPHGRSQFYVQNICCASEIPVINQIIFPLKGVKDVSVNTTTKTVYVNHDVGLVSAKELMDHLVKDGFPTTIIVDAAEASAAASKSQMVFVTSTVTFETQGMPLIEDTVASVFAKFSTTQLESYVMDTSQKVVTFKHNPFSLLAEDVASALQRQTGFQTTIRIDGAKVKDWAGEFQTEGNETMEHGQESMRYPRPTVILCGILWIVSMLSFIGENWEYLKYVALVSIALGLPPIAAKAMTSFRRMRFDANSLMFLASIGAVALQEYTEAAAVVFLFASSEWLEERATSRARQALSAIVQLRPDRANLIHPATQELVVIPASSVPIGALVSVKTGDKIPCDGVVVRGISTVDESSLTGESRPITKGPSDNVSGGTVNSGLSPITVQTTATAENSAVARLIRLVEEAQANRSETEKLVDNFARIYTPIVLMSALVMCSIPWAFGSETGEEWSYNGLILIVVACPCALIISTPVSYVAGLAATAQRGVLIKGGAILEALGQARHVCFDKTGTLTNGEFAMRHLSLIGERMSRNQVMQYLSLMEEPASHPMAQAIVNAARSESVTIPNDTILEKHSILAGEGVSGVINGKTVHVGNERLFERLGLLAGLSEKHKREVHEWKAIGGTVGYMSVEGYGIVCAFAAADSVRRESADVVRTLQDMGVSMLMLTGDNEETAILIGSQVGLQRSDVKFKLLPEEKLSFVEGISATSRATTSFLSNPCGCSKNGLVLFCGDGVNDAPALTAADVGVAMGEGAALAMETADVTLLDSNLEKLVFSIRMGQKVMTKIKQNVVFSIAVKAVVLVFALMGKTSLWAAIVSDVGAMILVTLNAMLLLPRQQQSAQANSLKGDIEQGQSEPANGLQRSFKDMKHETTGTSEVAASGIGRSLKHSYSHDHSHDHSPCCGTGGKDHGSQVAPSHSDKSSSCCAGEVKSPCCAGEVKDRASKAATSCSDKSSSCCAGEAKDNASQVATPCSDKSSSCCGGSEVKDCASSQVTPSCSDKSSSCCGGGEVKEPASQVAPSCADKSSTCCGGGGGKDHGSQMAPSCSDKRSTCCGGGARKDLGDDHHNHNHS